MIQNQEKIDRYVVVLGTNQVISAHETAQMAKEHAERISQSWAANDRVWVGMRVLTN